MAVIMSISGIYGYFSSSHEIDEIFDAQLAQYARLLVEVYPSGKIDSDNTVNTLGTVGHKYESKISYQIFDQDNKIIQSSDLVTEIRLAPFSEGYHDVTFGKDNAWKVFVIHDKDHNRWFMAGESLDIRRELVRKIAYVSFSPLILGIILSMLLINTILKKSLKPLDDIAQDISKRHANDLLPLQLNNVPEEVSVLVNNLNSLIARITASLERERRFSANAAHEIKTPLASLKLHLANLSSGSGGVDAGILNKAQLSCNLIQKLLEQLLLLNSLEPEYFQNASQPVELLPLCVDVLSIEAEFANEKDQNLQFECEDESLFLKSSASLLQILLRNLVHNAVLYTQRGGAICVRLKKVEASIMIEVIDNGPGIPASDRNRVFERFYRLGGDMHSSGADGSGLGLAIANDIVTLHGGSISLNDNDSGKGLRVQVILPL